MSRLLVAALVDDATIPLITLDALRLVHADQVKLGTEHSLDDHVALAWVALEPLFGY